MTEKNGVEEDEKKEDNAKSEQREKERTKTGQIDI